MSQRTMTQIDIKNSNTLTKNSREWKKSFADISTIFSKIRVAGFLISCRFNQLTYNYLHANEIIEMVKLFANV